MKRFAVAAAVWSVTLLPAGAVLSADASAPGSGAAVTERAVKKIDDAMSLRPQKARKLMESRPDLLVIDVRSRSEFKQGALDGTQNIPFINILEGRHTLPKDRPILLVCSIGGRSYAAGQILLERGYREVYNLDGGLADWQKERLPVTFQGVITR